MKIYILSFCVCFLTLCKIINAQNLKLDSLWKEYKKATSDTNKIKILINGIGYEYEKINLNISIKYYTEALQLSRKIKNKTFEANALQYIGIANKKKGNYSQAIEYYSQAIEVFKVLCSSSDKLIAEDAQNGISACCNNIGNVFLHLNDYEKAIEHYKKSLIISEKNGNKTGMSDSYLNIGIVYVDQGNYPKAIEFFLKSVKIKEEINDREGTGYCYNNLGELQREQGNYKIAIDYYTKALKIHEELSDIVGMATCYSNIGLVYSIQNKGVVVI